MNECVVYHKHLAGMDLTDGYIGISKNFDERMKQHHRDAFVKNSVYTVHEKMRMHLDDVITSKIFEGSINECFDYEEELRPRWRMGWNMAIGGGRPGSGWKPGNWLDNRLWHPEHGEKIISVNYKPPDMAKEFNMNSGNLRQVLQGRIPIARGWELADAQLAQRVDTRYRVKWLEAYFTNNEVIVKVAKPRSADFSRAYGLKAEYGICHQLMSGSRNTMNGWEISTEEEWLATAERVEFE